MRVGPGPGLAGRTLVGSECARLLSSVSWAPAEPPALLTTAGAGHRRAVAVRQQDMEQVWVTQLPNPCPHASPQHHTGARRCPLGPGQSTVTSCEHPALGAHPRSRPLSASPAVARLPGVGGGAPTPVFLPGESCGQRKPGRYSPQGREESHTTERLHFHFHFLKGLVGLHRTIQLQLLQHYWLRHRLGSP